jgi:hypothetical protein
MHQPQAVNLMKSSLRVLSLATLLALGVQTQASAQLANPGFEAHVAAVASTGSDSHVTFNYQPSGPAVGWTFGSGTGIAQQYDLVNALQGQKFAFLQNKTAELSQSFALSATSTVDLSFGMLLRPEYPSGQVVSVSVDGQELAQYTATNNTGWVIQQVALGTLSQGTHTLAFKGLSDYDVTGRDTTAYLDAVKMVSSPVPEPTSIALAAAGMMVAGIAARRRQRQQG